MLRGQMFSAFLYCSIICTSVTLDSENNQSFGGAVMTENVLQTQLARHEEDI